MKKKISLILSIILYLVAIFILIYYFSVEFNELLRLSPTGRIVLLLLSCLIMYFGGLALTKYIDEKYKNKVLKINIGIWFILYIILLSTLTLFDDYFFRGDFNILNWNSDILKIKEIIDKYNIKVNFVIDDNWIDEEVIQLLVKENFYEYKEELKAHIYDEKLLDIISKEIFKNELENKLESKKETKKLKI